MVARVMGLPSGSDGRDAGGTVLSRLRYMERDSFIFYRSFYEAIRDLPRDIRLEVYTALMEYALYGRLPEGMKPFAKGLFALMKPVIDTNTVRFNNGCKGGRKKKAPAQPSSSAEGEAPSGVEGAARKETPAPVPDSPSGVEGKARKDSAAKPTAASAFLPRVELQRDSETAAPEKKEADPDAAYLQQFFSPRRKNSLDTLCKSLGFKTPDFARLRSLADMVIAEWKLSETVHDSFSDWSRHLISTMRIKNKDLARAEAAGRPAGSRLGAAETVAHAAAAVPNRAEAAAEVPDCAEAAAEARLQDYTFDGGFGGADI